MMKVGDTVETLYGRGTLVGYKEVRNVCEVHLPFGKLYAIKASVRLPPSPPSSKARNAMEINDAYESLEKMRRLNLEVTCEELGISSDVNHQQCVLCLMAQTSNTEQEGGGGGGGGGGTRDNRFPWMIRNNLNCTKVRKPCLSCGSPVCPNHASSAFREEKINICLDCEVLFKIEFVVDCLTGDKRERIERVDRMIDLYDRTALLLNYSSQYIDGIAASLEKQKALENKIGAGGSTVGIVSGALGIAAAATILTPVGPPLLIASLLFGGSATAVQTGTEVKSRYFSEPHQLAGNIIALHGMLKNILKVADTLRDAVARDMVATECLKEDTPDAPLIEKIVDAYEKTRGGLLAAMTAGRLGMAGMEIGELARIAEAGATGSRDARFFSRPTTNFLRSARLARFAGGAISGVILLLEARCMHDTVKAIRAGNPCDKAMTLRRIQEELNCLPSTAELDRECENYLEAMRKRDRRLTEEQAVRLLIDTSRAQAEVERQAEERGILIVNGEDSIPQPPPRRQRTTVSNSLATPTKKQATAPGPPSKSMSGSLLERIQKFKKEEATLDCRHLFFDQLASDLLD